MDLVGVQSDRYSNAIPILVNPEHIDPSSISNDITKISTAPDLKLSKRGLKEADWFLAAGGNHRTEALRTVCNQLQEKISKANTDVESLGAKMKAKQRYKDYAEINDIYDELEKYKEQKLRTEKWSVILYDESK